MGTSISGYATLKSAPYANDYTDQLRLKLVNIIGQKAFDSFEKQVAQGNQKSLASLSKLSSSIVLSQVNLVWSEKNAAFYSKGLIGVSNILKKEINAMVEGYVEIKRTGYGDAFQILLTPNADKWYYISYENYRMALCSNDEEFTKAVQAKSKGETAMKYFVVAADPSEKVQFNKDFNLNFLGKEINDEYTPAQGTSPIETLPAEEAPKEEKPAEEGKKKNKKGDESAPAVDESAPQETAPADNTESVPAEEEKGKKKKKGKKEETPEEKQGF